MTSEPTLAPGVVAWANLDPVVGREQAGHRPVVIVASEDYLLAADTLVIIVPVTTVDRDWPNHVLLTGSVGVDDTSWAMTEQVRTISRQPITKVVGSVDDACFDQIREWLVGHLDLDD